MEARQNAAGIGLESDADSLIVLRRTVAGRLAGAAETRVHGSGAGG